MNTGIGDAVNLGWKLVHVLEGRAAPSLLDSYEPERIGLARTLISTTDRAFTGMVGEGLLGGFARRIVVPLIFSVGTRFSLTRHAIFRTVSQTGIHYPDSPLSQGTAGDIHGGDRLPWSGLGGDDNFRALQSLDWQAHIYGDPTTLFKHSVSNSISPCTVSSGTRQLKMQESSETLFT